MGKRVQYRCRTWRLLVVATAANWLLATATVWAQNSSLVDSKEYKLLLRVDKFTDWEQGAEDFWAGVCQTADKLGLETDGEIEKKQQRVVRFLDTEDFDLRTTHKFVFRERVGLKSDGTRKRNKRITLKFRSPDAALAKSKHVASREGDPDDRKVKFEQDVVPGGTRYSHSGETKVKTRLEFGAVRDLTKAFEGLESLPIQDKRVMVVNDFEAHELKVDAGEITLTDHHTADASFTFWRHKTAERPLLVAEFSFNYDVDPDDVIDRATASDRATQLFWKIQCRLEEWLDESAMTKTAVAYSFGQPVP